MARRSAAGWFLKIFLWAVLVARVSFPAFAQDWRGPVAIEATVEDSKGRNISGAEVRLVYLDPEGGGMLPSVLTDAGGKATIGGLAAGRWVIEVRHAGHMTYRAEITISADNRPEVVSAAQEMAPGAVSTMKVRLARGRPGSAPPPARVVATPPAAPVSPPSAPAPARPATPAAPVVAPAQPAPAPAPVREPVPAPAVAAPAVTPPAAAPAPSPAPAPPVAQAPKPTPATAAATAPAPPPPVTAAPASPPVTKPAATLPPAAPTPSPAAPPATPSVPKAPATTPAAAATPAPAGPPAPAVTAPKAATSPVTPAASAPPAPVPAASAPAAAGPAPAAPPAAPPAPSKPPVPEVAPSAAPAVVSSPSAAAPPVTGDLPPSAPAATPPRQRVCVECAPGEKAQWGEATIGGGASAGCPADLQQRLAEVALAGGAVEALSAALGDGCRVVRVELPAGAHFTGFRYEASSRGVVADCLPGRDCPAGETRFPFEPVIRKEGGRTTLLVAFESTAADWRNALVAGYWNLAKK